MNAVGIDVSKGKSMVTILRPFGEIVSSPFEIKHTSSDCLLYTSRTGLSRSNIRFYEKEKLIEPSRNESNGYRDYSENDVENIKKIAYLRTLGISIEDIRSIISEKVTLQEMLKKQKEVLKNQITDLNKAKLMCEKMLDEDCLLYTSPMRPL